MNFWLRARNNWQHNTALSKGNSFVFKCDMLNRCDSVSEAFKKNSMGVYGK